MPDLKAREQFSNGISRQSTCHGVLYVPDLAFQQSCALQNRPIFLVFPVAIDETGTDKVAVHPL